jgi:RNA polymerase sigma-70 factor, ECF subfamily
MQRDSFSSLRQMAGSQRRNGSPCNRKSIYFTTMGAGDPPITQLLLDARRGNTDAANALFPIVYAELHEIALRHMNGEREFHTLQPTALVNEAYLKLLGGTLSYNDKEHFLCIAAEAMRRILIDYAKARAASKRGNARKPVTLEACHLAITTPQEDILIVDEAISRLKGVDDDAAALVVMRFYMGLSLDEIAQARGVSVSTINREWAFARAFLLRQLSEQ